MVCARPVGGTSVSINPGCDAENSTPEEFVNCVLNMMQQFALDLTNDAISKANSAIYAADGADWSIQRDEDKFKMTAKEPTIPSVDNARTIYDAERENIIPLIKDLYDEFLADQAVTVFNPARDAAGAWLYDVIVNGKTGLPVQLEEQIWGRSRGRLLAQASTAQKNASERYSALGWTLPNGAVIAAVNDAGTSVHREIGSASVEVAVKQFDTAIETARFAVDQALKVHMAMMGAAVDWVRAMIDAMDQALKVSEVDPNVKANLINATANMFKARISKDSVLSGSYNNFYQRVREDVAQKSNDEISKLNLSVKARESASEVMKGLGMAGLTQFSGIVSAQTSG